MGNGEAVLSIFAIVECFFFSGIIYGWNSLVFVLKSEDVFKYMCTSSNSTNSSAENSCKRQDETFNLIFSAGYACVCVLSVLIGIVITRIGEVKTRVLYKFVFAVGTLFLIFTSKDEQPWLLLPGFIFVGTAGFSLLYTNIRIASVIPLGSAVFACLINGSYDSSAAMLLVVKVLHEHGISYKQSFLGILMLYLVVSGFCTLFQWLVIDRKELRREKANEIKQNIINEKNSDSKTTINQSTGVTWRTVIHISDSKTTINQSTEVTWRTVIHISDSKTTINQSTEVTWRTVIHISDSKTTINQSTEVTWRTSICSINFVMQLIWVTTNVLNLIFFVGSLNRKLEKEYTDLDDVNHFTNVFGYVMIGSIVASFLAGLFQEWQKWLFRGDELERRRRILPLVAPLSLCSLLGVIIAVFSFITTTRWSLYISFGVVILYRALIFGIALNYIITVFPLKYSALLFGINQSVFGIFSFLQYPLFIWRDLYDGAEIHVGIALLGLGIVSLLHAVRTWFQAMKKKVKVKKDINC